jgi:hypothetical protein
MRVGGWILAPRAGKLGELSLFLRRERDVDAHGRPRIEGRRPILPLYRKAGNSGKTGWHLQDPRNYEGGILAVQKMKRPLFPDLSGKIVIAAEVGGEAAKVRVDLNEADFRSACDTIRDGKNVALSGIIRHDVRTREYELSEPTDFEIIDGP